MFSLDSEVVCVISGAISRGKIEWAISSTNRGGVRVPHKGANCGIRVVICVRIIPTSQRWEKDLDIACQNEGRRVLREKVVPARDDFVEMLFWFEWARRDHPTIFFL